MNHERKLAAIMFTDMVGYSALTQKNEDLAIELLELHREILRPIFKIHNGREIETIGDAFFVEFNSSVESAKCAIQIQQTLYERNKNVETDKKILLRIGLHVGDVIHRGERVHGDGVNIAARLEPLSPKGGICLSEDVARQVRNKIDLPIKKIGDKKLKNIEVLMGIYCVQFPWVEDIKEINIKNSENKNVARIIISALLFIIIAIVLIYIFDKKQNHLHKRIAVLPLVNISENEEDEYFADGMTEELISKLARVKDLIVISRTSVMKYKNRINDLEEIGDELNVSAILEGTVRKVSDKAKINIRLVDVETQEQIWNEEFEREVKDIFAVQSNIALKVVQGLKIELLSSEIKQIEKNISDNKEAHELYLLGKFNLNKRTNESISTALNYFNKAIEADSAYSLAYVGLADCYTLIGGAGYGALTRDDVIQIANKTIIKALEIDSTLAEAYNTLAYIKFRLEWDWKGAEENFVRAIELKPNYAEAHEKYGLFLALHKRFDEARAQMKKAYNLNPLSNSVLTGIGRIEHFDGKYKLAEKQFDKVLKINPDYAEAVFGMGLTYSQLNRYDEAIAELKRAVILSNQRLMVITALGLTYAKANLIDSTRMIYEQILERSKTSEVSPFYLAFLEWELGEKEKSIDKFYLAYQNHFGIMVYLNASPLYGSKLRDEPRFQKLLELMGFKK